MPKAVPSPQLAKLVATIRALDPDIAALMELENDGYGPQSSLAQLVAALNADVKGAAADADYALEKAVRSVAELVSE